ncbi:MAG: hypothetical protein KIT15_10330 [Xanthobacteraceae bacterium]|nr:hypothetical protein [Xanthobacteraceae bacterium]
MSWLWSFFTPMWGYGTLLLAALGLAATYAPSLRLKIAAGFLFGITLAVLISFSVGYNYADTKCRAEWKAAEQAARQLGKDTRDAGIRDDADGLRDPNDRNNQANPR